jgi:hypothetical protein
MFKNGEVNHNTVPAQRLYFNLTVILFGQALMILKIMSVGEESYYYDPYDDHQADLRAMIMNW